MSPDFTAFQFYILLTYFKYLIIIKVIFQGKLMFVLEKRVLFYKVHVSEDYLILKCIFK